jgi:putative ABC transport system permease protein
MRLSNISLNNLRRRKGKALLLSLGLAVGVAAVVSVLSITAALQLDTERKIDEFGANILITPLSEDLSLSYGGVAVGASYVTQELSNADVAAIWTIHEAENISTVAPKLLSGVEVNGIRALLVGVDFTAELRMKRWWALEGQRPQGDHQLILGQDAAHRLRVGPGGEMEILGERFTVAAVLQPIGNQEDSLIYADLGVVQRLLGKPDSVSLVEVAALCSTCPIEVIVEQIGEKLPDARVMALAQAVKSREQTVEQLTNFSLALAGVVLLIGGLVVLTTMMSSVTERTREIGVFRAVGFRKSHIMRILLVEALLLSGLAGIIGWLIGTAGSGTVASAVAKLQVPVIWDPMLGLGAIGLALLVGLAGSIYPALRASSLDPAEALRSI